MRLLQKISASIDWLNGHIGRLVYWLVLAMVLISAGNAISRKVLSLSSNAWLELQWYLFSAVFLLAAGYTLLRNEHVRIDILAGRLSPKGQAWIDVFGTIFFLLPFSLMLTWLSWPYFTEAYVSGEVSGSAGGLVLWWARVLLPAGFFLLALQGVSELIKRIAFIAGKGPDPIARHDLKAEEALVEEMRQLAERKGER